MKKQKSKTSRKISGDDHPLAWNPMFLWQLLRKSKSYQKAVELCFKNKNFHAATTIIIENLRSADHLATWEAFLNNDPDDWNKFGKNPKSRVQSKVELSNFDASFLIYGNREYFKHDLDNAILSQGDAHYGLCPEFPPMLKFLEKFGDVIRFPVPYQIEIPNPVLFKVFWNLRPASIISKSHLDSVYRERSKWNYGSVFYRRHKEMHNYHRKGMDIPFYPEQNSSNPLFRLVHLHLELNTHFRRETVEKRIHQELAAALDDIYKHHPTGELRRRRGDIDKFVKADLLRVAELYEERKSSLEIGKILFPRNSPEIIEAKKIHERQGNTVEYIQKYKAKVFIDAIKPYMDFFNRD